ncbi:uncharacterized protein LOC130293453 isoform X3 [Hyla sarda]|nr:uncharacterized protein LOC130293453 isoform X3 [Hyla sarda]XP_056398409.1 uncharacterized protein LOC130293453 isoform X3 [Hyla sarda]XP_056398493.1 uncharacterized protein LOC130293453 isoform X3 [Hyla sarda]XP_056398583.1 uncharacterized protein LOC130293453 isoform X3 [Hyla sarda]XP_056398665.1 uncharacterized protein LOC130293453 isoform X3 [Hyla sarda]XP_056398745.1 uncharacterized protein LOC130293453 isoform X3 [Hyla sarda]
MSPGKDVESLTGLCLQNIADNMENVWMKDYTDKNMEEYRFMYIEGPFNQMAGPLVQNLIQILGDSHKLTKAGLHLLLQPHLTELSLRSCAGLFNNAMAQLVTVRCKLLTSLDLHSCSRIPASSLVSLIERLPRLQKLCLSETQSDALVLATIGTSCQRLRELDVSRCKKISPASVLSLVYDVKSGQFCCQGLRVLLLQDIKPQGEQWVYALCFVLLALPGLKQLANPSLADAMRLLYLRDFSPSGFPPENFPSMGEVARTRSRRTGKCNQGVGMEDTRAAAHDSTLHLKKLEDLDEEDVSILGCLCQGLEEVVISLRGQPECSWSLMQWPNLTHLALHCPEHPLRTLEDILPSIHPVSHSLRNLSLQNLLWCQEDSLSTLLTWCTKLQSFQGIFTVSRYSVSQNVPELPPWLGNPLPLPHLHTFSLLLEGDDPIQDFFKHKLGGFLVSLLKGCPKLESLSLCNIPALLDTVLEMVYGSTQPEPLYKLREVSLCNCNVTQWGASLILKAKNDLKTLDLSHCKDVTCRDYHKLQERVRKDKRNVNIVWQ